MPAKKASASKAPAKSAAKAPAKPAAKKPVKAAAKTTKPAAKAPAKAATPAEKTPPVKKAPAKTASKAAPAAKKAAKPAPAKKEALEAKAAPPKAAQAPAPAAPKDKAKTPKPAPAPTPVEKKTTKDKSTTVPPAPPKKETAAPKPSNTGKTGGSKSPVVVVHPLQPRRGTRLEDEGITLDGPPKKPVLPSAFLKKQRQRLVELRDAYLNSAEGVTSESLRNEGGDASAFGMHQADAGSDAYDRDFALSLLAKEQDAIYEINEALKRIDAGTYGICEMSGELIPEERLEALPFTRFTVTCQARIESEQRTGRWNRPVRSLFGLDESAEEADDDRDEDDTTTSSGNNNESLDFSKE